MEALGIDIGGSGVKGNPVDLDNGRPTADRFRLDTPQPSTPAAVAQTVRKVVQHFNWTGSVGITFPGVVFRGTIRTAANMDHNWIGVDAVKLFGEALAGQVGDGAPVVVLNDADAAGLAEMAYGAGRGRSGVTVMLTFGTGIGSALFIDGKLVPNTEFGHLQIRGKDAEKRASARARTEKQLSWKKWAVRVEEYLETVEALLSPDLVILGGGVTNHPDRFVPLLHVPDTEVVPADLANEAGIVGAAMATVSTKA
ncbi:MAG TPA: ROK family protein [Actinocrinis sp.]